MLLQEAIKPGDIVTFNDLDDAVRFDVVSRDSYLLVVREHGTEYRTEVMDVSCVHRIDHAAMWLRDIGA